MRSVKEIDMKDKRVLMRVDFNVPMDNNGHILDDARIVSAIPTIKYISGQGARLILMSHLGRPDGQRKEKYSLQVVGKHLEQLLGRKVYMADDCVGPTVQEQVDKMAPGEIILLENVRFHAEEEKNDPAFSQTLANLGDVFVNDAFGTAHRAHASTCGVADYLPAYAGFLLENEVDMLRSVIEHPESPRMAILGGAKIKDKLGLIRNLLDKMDILLIGGGMANTFLKAQGISIGKSICEEKLLAEARELLELANAKNKKILLPVDVVLADDLTSNSAGIVADIDHIPADKMIVDIGPKTVALFSEAISQARTIIWNGPVGVYENDQFVHGTEALVRAIADSSAVSVVGGGDSSAAVHKLGLDEKITHISTGGGATLELLEGIQLPGVKSCEW
ncbi:Phosphoglycerate kinase [Syntrophomonas zehnderi OL-4]|uniref:Phosphoglycerate kinase n=1 Tax=Syntrophomonas zehnderi OL-4 TaxID=690567 RepID=A0A0E4GTW4_9FIRM|nr:phosphoglycerate kinase [Syntrophomonas zehnderi]CQB51973.1 Phosphoglycerate kinase [Syntrophomonas zehnderi OL-4]